MGPAQGNGSMGDDSIKGVTMNTRNKQCGRPRDSSEDSDVEGHLKFLQDKMNSQAAAQKRLSEELMSLSSGSLTESSLWDPEDAAEAAEADDKVFPLLNENRLVHIFSDNDAALADATIRDLKKQIAAAQQATEIMFVRWNEEKKACASFKEKFETAEKQLKAKDDEMNELQLQMFWIQSELAEKRASATKNKTPVAEMTNTSAPVSTNIKERGLSARHLQSLENLNPSGSLARAPVQSPRWNHVPTPRESTHYRSPLRNSQLVFNRSLNAGQSRSCLKPQTAQRKTLEEPHPHTYNTKKITPFAFFRTNLFEGKKQLYDC